MNPYEIVSSALGCDIDSLQEDSGLYNHPDWDSFGHLQVIATLEDALGLTIPNDWIVEYTSMKRIMDLFKKITSKEKAMLERKVSYESFDGLVLEGTYTRPASKISGSILLVHGITSTRDEWGFYSGLAEYLAGYGIASYRIDYRCHGIDKTPFEQFSMLGVVNDISSAFGKMKELVADERTPTYVMGCSFGGGLSAYWAKISHTRLKKLILCYPVIDYKADIIKTAGDWEKALRLSGYIEYAGKPITRQLINEIPYVNTIDSVTDPVDEITIIHGVADTDVPVSMSQKYCTSAKCKLIVIEGAEHGFAVPGDLDLVDPKSIDNFKLVYGHVYNELEL